MSCIAPQPIRLRKIESQNQVDVYREFPENPVWIRFAEGSLEDASAVADVAEKLVSGQSTVTDLAIVTDIIT